MQVLLLPVGRECFALDRRCLREVVRRPAAVRLPSAPSAVRGVFNLRGEILPLFDLATLLGLGSLAEAPYAVVVETALGPAGLVTSAMPRSAELGPSVGATEGPATVATHLAGDGLGTLLDVEALLLPSPDSEA